MIIHSHGDLLKAEVDALVNPVNCVGKAGRGLALQFRTHFPENFAAYAEACRTNCLQLGSSHVFATSRPAPAFIINFPTKYHWRDNSRLSAIEDGLADLVDVIRIYQIQSIAIPALGCGLGGLSWLDVRPRIVAALAPLEALRVLLFVPRAGGQSG